MDNFKKLLEEKIIEYENKTYEWQINYMNCHDYYVYMQAQKYQNIYNLLKKISDYLNDR